MSYESNQEAILARIVRWGEGQPLVRAMILTSTRAVPGAQPDLFSDYDVILALADVQPFFAERGWLEAFGRVLVMYRDPLLVDDGLAHSGNVVQFEDGLKIDFSLWPVEMLRRVVSAARLPAEFDAGYRVLLDKDHLADGLQPPSYRAYIPAPPAEETYREYVECFLLEAIYFAKLMWRGDLMAAKYVHTTYMIDEHLRPMLEWRVEIDRQWAWKPAPYGRGLQKHLRPDLRAALEQVYSGAGFAENWQALYRTIALMRTAAQEVGAAMGFAYPEDLEQRTIAYLERVRRLAPGAPRFE